MKTQVSHLVIGILWFLAIGAGVAAMMRYENNAGPVGAIPSDWPMGSRLTLDRTRPTLIMFAHPKCPCTRASLGELNRLLAKSANLPEVHICFFTPKDAGKEWAKSDLWRSAAEVPGLVIHEDVEGQEAKRFGAETSGQIVLYDSRGKLLFKGGITAARGQAGDNAGESQILALLAGQAVNRQKTTTVFGCGLQNPAPDPAN